MTKPDPALDLSERDKRWMRDVPETVPIAFVKRERTLQCDGCGERVPASTLDVRLFTRGLKIRTCKDKACWSGYKTKAGK